jgi:hypothetical protein
MINSLELCLSHSGGGETSPEETQARIIGPGLYAESVPGGGSPATGQVRTVAGTAIEVRWAPLVSWFKPINH